MINCIWQSLCLDLVYINVYAKFYQNIPKGSSDRVSLTFFRIWTSARASFTFFRIWSSAKPWPIDKWHLTIPWARSCQYQCVCKISSQYSSTGRRSSIGCASAWYADGHGFDPHVRQNILSLRFHHEKISTTILSLPLIQEGQLSVTGERMGTKYW